MVAGTCRASSPRPEKGDIHCVGVRHALQLGRQVTQELSCVDLSLDIAERCLEIVRGTIEEHARAAKEKEYQSLLRELDAEEAAKKVGK